MRELPGFAYGDSGVFFGKDFLLMKQWDYAALRKTIADVCEDIQAPTWRILARPH